ncbi:MAG: hypothetical protein ACPG4U_07030 [Pseudomonadales bacterium]
MPTKNAGHGRCDITVDGDLIVLEAYGPWNKEFFIQLHTDLYYSALELRDSGCEHYGILVNMHGNALLVQDAIDYHSEFVKLAQTDAVAMDLCDCDTPGITRDIFNRIYACGSFDYAFFERPSEARIWLEQRIKSKRQNLDHPESAPSIA